MSALKTVLAAAALVAVTAPAMAQDASPWDLRERNAYVLDMQNKMWSTRGQRERLDHDDEAAPVRCRRAQCSS